jgi:hypothetical protein
MGELTDDGQDGVLLASRRLRRTARAKRGGGGVGQLVLLVADEKAAGGVGSGSEVAEKLADLGVTSVSILRDERTTAVVLEGWAFDIDRSAEAAVRLVAGDSTMVRVLRPVAESALHASLAASTATTERRHA